MFPTWHDQLASPQTRPHWPPFYVKTFLRWRNLVIVLEVIYLKMEVSVSEPCNAIRVGVSMASINDLVYAAPKIQYFISQKWLFVIKYITHCIYFSDLSEDKHYESKKISSFWLHGKTMKR